MKSKIFREDLLGSKLWRRQANLWSRSCPGAIPGQLKDAVTWNVFLAPPAARCCSHVGFLVQDIAYTVQCVSPRVFLPSTMKRQDRTHTPEELNTRMNLEGSCQQIAWSYITRGITQKIYLLSTLEWRGQIYSQQQWIDRLTSQCGLRILLHL